MKIFQRFAVGRKTLLFGVCLLFATTTATAQPAEIILSNGNITLSDLFGEIKRQTGTTVIFDAGALAPAGRVTLPAGENSVASLLDRALPKSDYAWRVIGTYIVVRTLPQKSVTATVVEQPSREDFERDVAAYSARNLPERVSSETIMRYDTVNTVVMRQRGIFNYPDREFIPTEGYAAQNPLPNNSLPILAVKTNAVWWAARGTINGGLEAGTGRRTSVGLSGGINRWGLDGTKENNNKMTHWIVKPEFRYWLCQRFYGHFFNLHAFLAKYNVGGVEIPLLFEKEFRYEGKAYGAGVSYGYHLPLAKRWGLEFTAGVGAAIMDYSKSDCLKCADPTGDERKTYFGPTELGVKLTFIIR